MWSFNEFKENIAIIDENDVCITYLELDEEIIKLKEKIDQRSLVFVLCNDTLGNIFSYIAMLKVGSVPAMLKSDLDFEMFSDLYEKYKPKYLFLPTSDVSKFNEITTEIVHEVFSYTLIKTKYFDVEYEIHQDLALLLTTSGSTGSPKFVRQSYKNIESNTKSIVEYLKITSAEKPITTLPANYTYGLSIINSHISVGATILVTNKSIMQKEFWEFFKKYEATSFGGVPYTYEILKKLRFFKMELPSLKTMTQAGGKLLPKLHEEFSNFAKENNQNFVVMYGQCEATARMAYLPHEKNLEKIGSMGIAIPYGKLELIDLNQNIIQETHITGELRYIGENVTLGYAESLEDLAKGDERNGVLITGDMAYFDEDGYFFIDGRKKRFLKIFGNRVNLDEVERLLKAEFLDVECACSGVDDKLFIYTTNEQLKDVMKKYISAKTKINPVAIKTYYIKEIPKNEAGKTLYSKLEDFND